MSALRLACVAITAAAALHITLGAASIPSGFTEKLVASGLASPTAMQFAPDGRLFVAEQSGRLRVIKDGTLLATPFLTVTVNASGERGLLGMAFDPDFASNRFVYIYYTATTPTLHNRVSRFTASGDVAVAGSEAIILELDNLSNATNHNGGAINFGNDGKLYIAVGDNANGANAQSLATLHGKMLRINRDGTIPGDNPFVTSAAGKNRAIWALGLRNPFTFAFHRDGRMFINDVGQNTWEEINDGISGANYGWPTTEGPTNDPRFVSPRYAYSHASGGCAITGGAFYSPMTFQYPAGYLNDYFLADYCGGWIRQLDHENGNTVTTFATGVSFPVDLKVADDGSVYYLARGGGATTGTVSQITFGAAPPSITSHPASQAAASGDAVTFSVRASGAAPLSYQWQRNGVAVTGANGQDYTLASVAASDNGARFRAVVSNDHGSVTSDEAVLTVSGNEAPTAVITRPLTTLKYKGGMQIKFVGSASDPEEGALGAAAFTWRVDFHHDTHTHPFMAPIVGVASGSFRIPYSGETATNVWYRVHLTVRDAAGATHSVHRDVFPQIVRLTLATSPPGLRLGLDDQPVTTPHSFDSVVNVYRRLEAVSPQTVGATWYVFSSWANGRPAAHRILAPAVPTTYTATYQVSQPVGSGLTGAYFDQLNFSGPATTRIDKKVDFNWSSNAPMASMGADTFSVRWTGQVMPQFSETYTFHTVSNDGVRVWVNGQLLIDNWTDHPAVENTGSIALTAGQRYDIRMDYYDNAGNAVARLLWSSPSTVKAVIPTTRLFP